MISIVVPIYNADPYLHQCLQSIQSQDFEDFEILMVDDGSTDNSAHICQDFSSDDSRFVYLYKKNSGVSETRNYGIEHSRGEYIVFVDSDDYLEKNYLSSMYDVMIKTPVDLVVEGIVMHKSDETKTKETFPPLISNMEALSKDLYYRLIMFRGPYCKLFKMDIIRKYDIRFPKGISYGEDAIFYYDYLLYCTCIAFSSCCGYNYRVNDNGSLSTAVRKPEDYYFFLKKRTEQIHKLQTVHCQDRYSFPSLSENNLNGVKTMLTGMKHWKYSPTQCKAVIERINRDGFLSSIATHGCLNKLLLLLLRANTSLTNTIIICLMK